MIVNKPPEGDKNAASKQMLSCFYQRYTVDGYLGELQGGVTYINTVKDMLEEAENDWPKMLARLQRVRATLLSKKNFLVNLTGDKVWCGVTWCGAQGVGV